MSPFRKLLQKELKGPLLQKEVDNTSWVTEFPIEINEAVMARGQERFKIYCSVCHGLSGEGDGLVTQRAQLINCLYLGDSGSTFQ
ncbi:MAG: hypothetical protein R3C11_05240 [Planctomycetaceae bacterium]